TAPSDEQDTLRAYLPSTPRLCNGGATQFSNRFAISSSETAIDISCLSESIVTISPSSNTSIEPLSCASGAICPTARPCVPPEKRPSVNNATFSPNPLPTRIEEIDNISGIPGPPFGPT